MIITREDAEQTSIGNFGVNEYSNKFKVLSEWMDLATKIREDRERKNNIKNVIFNDPATIVFWKDGTKTVVKKGENDIYDPEKGLAMAIAKKALGNKGNYYNKIKEWLPVDYVPVATPIRPIGSGQYPWGMAKDEIPLFAEDKFGGKICTRYYYAGKSKIVCAGDCYHALNIKPENRTTYFSLEEALADGSRPCKHCYGIHKEEKK